MSNYEAICFFDLDGTLLNGYSQVDTEVAEVIRQLRENQILPVIATGRSIIEVEDVMKKANIDSIICLNGQYIQVAGEKVYEKTFKPAFIKQVIDFAESLGHELSFYNPFHFWSTKHTEVMKKAYEVIHSDCPDEMPTQYEKETVNMLLLLSDEPEKDSLYIEKFPELTYFRNSPFSVDTISAGNSKGVGVKRLLETLHIEDLPTYAFGDGRNDIPLLKTVEHPVAMGNAVNELKEIAEYITADNTKGGLIQALHHYHLI